MVYYYDVKIKFVRGDSPFIIEYHRNFMDIGRLFGFLEENYRGYYKVISIYPRKFVNLSPNFDYL